MAIGQTFDYQPSDLNQDGARSWGALERAVLTKLIQLVEQYVGTNSINIDGDLTLNGHGLISAKFIQMVVNGDAGNLRQQWVDTNGDLWYRDGQGRTVQVTSGGTLAIAESLGGFVGDYISTNPNGASYYNSIQEFKFTAPSPAGNAASMNVGDVRIRKGTDTDYVALTVPSNLAGSYTLRLPGANPSVRSVLTCDATGGLSFSPTTAAPVRSVLTCDPTGGLDYYVSSSMTYYIDPCSGRGLEYTAFSYLEVGYSIGGISSLGKVDWPIPIKDGDTLTSVSFVTIGATRVTASILFRENQAVNYSYSPSSQQIARLAYDGSNSVHTVATMQSGTYTMTGTLPYVVAQTGSLRLRIENGLASSVIVGAIKYTVARRVI